MSIRVQSLIWEFAPYEGNTLLTFLALGDWADDEGFCWPRMEQLAKKSRQSIRSSQYAVSKLSKDGYLIRVCGSGKGNSNEFHINMQKLHLLSGQRVQSTTPKGAIHDTKGCKLKHRNKEDPSLDPSVTVNCPTCGNQKLIHQHPSIPGPRLVPCPDCQSLKSA